MSRSVPAAHLAQVRVHEVWVEGEAGVLLLHDGEREEVLEGGDVEPGVQHQGHLLELDYVARLVRVIRQVVEPHLVCYFVRSPATNISFFYK